MSRISVVLVALFWAVPTVFAQLHSEWRESLAHFSKLKNDRKYGEAERVLLDLWIEAERNAPTDHWVGGINHELGAFYYELGKHFEAERFFKRALEFWDQHKPTRMEDQVAVVNNLAVLYLDENRHELAVQLYAKYQARLTALPADHPEIARSWNNLGTIHFQRHEFVEAENYFVRALALWGKNPDSDRTDLIALLNNLGVIYSKTGRLDKALEAFTRILSLEATSFQNDALMVVKSNLNVGAIYCLTKRFDDASKYYDKALQEALNTLGPEHPLAASAAAQYAQALRTMKRKSEAKRMEKLARQLREKNPERATARLTVDLGELERANRR